jgi:hypothetical protein
MMTRIESLERRVAQLEERERKQEREWDAAQQWLRISGLEGSSNRPDDRWNFAKVEHALLVLTKKWASAPRKAARFASAAKTLCL